MKLNEFRFLAIASCALAVSLMLCFSILAWSEPDATPPEGNVSAPINTSSNAQTKIGPLGIKLNDLGYWISQVGQSLAFFNSDTGGNPKDARMVIGQDGNVGIGMAVPGKKLEVAGAFQADQFCLGGTCCSKWEDCF